MAAFNRIAQYDAAISNYLSSLQEDGSKSEYPAQMNATFVKVQDLRYGENSHQSAALYRDLFPAPGSLVTGKQLQEGLQGMGLEPAAPGATKNDTTILGK